MCTSQHRLDFHHWSTYPRNLPPSEKNGLNSALLRETNGWSGNFPGRGARLTTSQPTPLTGKWTNHIRDEGLKLHIYKVCFQGRPPKILENFRMGKLMNPESWKLVQRFVDPFFGRGFEGSSATETQPPWHPKTRQTTSRTKTRKGKRKTEKMRSLNCLFFSPPKKRHHQFFSLSFFQISYNCHFVFWFDYPLVVPNIAGWNIPMFNRKGSIFNPGPAFPATAMLVYQTVYFFFFGWTKKKQLVGGLIWISQSNWIISPGN